MESPSIKPYMRHAASVSTIVARLKELGILGAFYTRIYPDGTVINLANDARWTELYFSRLQAGAYKNDDVIDQCFADIGASLWALKPSNLVWQDARHFGYGNGVMLSYNTKDFREFTGFYSSIENSAINQFYINNIDKIKNFRAHFLAQAADLIQAAEKERRTLAKPIFDPIFHSQTQRNIEPLPLTHKNTNLFINLSPQRAQCLEYLIQGKSSKEIADIMQLSSRTVDHYLGILRKELGCRTSRELIARYNEQQTRII